MPDNDVVTVETVCGKDPQTTVWDNAPKHIDYSIDSHVDYIQTELYRSRLRYPDYSIARHSAFLNEALEASQAILKGKSDWRDELYQVMACCIRLLDEGDDNFQHTLKSKGIKK